MLQTEFEFTLPKGYVDTEGNVHKTGIMRLATAADEIIPMKDPRVHQNRAYMVIIILSRVIVKLGSISMITTKIVEDLFAGDLEFLQRFYQQINETGKTTVKTQCPKCATQYELEPYPLGE